MNVIIVTPPHTNPVGPTLGPALLSAHLKKAYPDINVKSLDMGLDSMYWLLSEPTIQQGINKLEQRLKSLERKTFLNYSLQKEYHTIMGAYTQIVALKDMVPQAISDLKNPVTFQNSLRRENANFIINQVLSSLGKAWGDTILTGSDYRIRFSPFSITDIDYVMAHESLCIYNDFIDTWLFQNNIQNVDYLGISISFAKQIFPALLTAKKAKELNPKIFVQLGGSMMAHLNRDYFKPLLRWCDCIVQKEGEYPIECLVGACIQGNKEIKTSYGAIFLDDNGNLIFGDSVPFLNIETEKTPDFSNIKLNDYIVPSPVIPLQLGRSCYWGKCSFCCLNTAFEHKNCWNSPLKVVEDIEFLINNYGITTVEFVDDAIPPAFARQLSDELLRRNCEVKWFGYARFDPGFDYALLCKMHQSGCVGLKFGLESASPSVLNKMNKGIQISIARKIFLMTKQAGIIPQAAFFFGFPGERLEDMILTTKFIEEIVLNNGILAYNGTFRLLKSMPLLDDPTSYGIKKISKWNLDEELIDYYTVEMDDMSQQDGAIKMMEARLASQISQDLTRSVDLRRYWFAGYGDFSVSQNVTKEYAERFICKSPFNLALFQIKSDIRQSDFLPGKGIYSTKSYIADGLHSQTISRSLDKYYPLIQQDTRCKYRYDPTKNCFIKL